MKIQMKRAMQKKAKKIDNDVYSKRHRRSRQRADKKKQLL